MMIGTMLVMFLGANAVDFVILFTEIQQRKASTIE